ncbi:Nn.00g049690.m01.CDS01 [Neocucurbitaria sp. VM-36]
MHRYTAGTPCPPPHVSFPNNHYNDYGRASSMYAPSYATDEPTADIEYTTALQANLRHARPRRPMRSMRKSAFNPSLDIFEDVAHEDEQHQAEFDMKRTSRASIMPQGTRPKRSTILAHPAQKMPRAAPLAQDPQLDRPHRRRASHMLSERPDANVNATVQLREELLEKKELRKQGPKKDPRRRTIYVPSDDTTVVTIHPGQSTHAQRNPRENSPDIGLDLVTLSEEEGNNLLPALKREKKVPRKSLALPPKRGPLSSTTRSLQSVSFASDVMGSGGGKENLPPGMEIIESKSNGTHIEINFNKVESKKHVTKPSTVHSIPPKDLERIPQIRKRPEGTQKRLRPRVTHDDPPAKSIKARADGTASMASSRASLRATIKTARAKTMKANRAPLSSSSPFHTDKSPPTALRRQRTEHAPASITMMHIVGKRPQPQEKYPVLKEDLAQPELYEDNWLTYQEVAITQLLNSVFDAASKDPNAEQSPEDFRKKMLALYHDPSMPPLHKRLQASLQYGALSIPKDLLAQTLRLKDDVGLRKKFLSLWTKSYDLNALRAAAETIIGRQINTPCRLSTGSTSSDDGSRVYRAERRAIESFLDVFLIKNEDAVRVKSGGGSIASITRGDDDFGSQGWSWRRTALRSLMLVLLLDKAKTTDSLPGCLFQTTSSFKTSVEVLHQLSNILLPSLGDITRPLGHLSYKVEHAQYPLQEYTYHIDNIAVDLRDGIMLTRLVDLLLYPASTLAAQAGERLTIAMPSGELLTSSFDLAQKESWILSQHLKFPAIGRPQKVYNVQLALTALNGVRGIALQAVSGIRAEDIVDGHREKTLSLLWSLVGKCGLGSLVDWPQLVKETDRFREHWYSNRDNFGERELDSDDDEATTELDGLVYHRRLLLSWSRSIARLHGLRISNLTTSFADPKVLEVIVDTYLPSTLITTMRSDRLGLAAKLKAVGCSASFIALLTPQYTSARSIPSRDFTLLTLAFLASRLLPLSLTHRAASTIQRAFRRHIVRRETSQRIVAMKIAHDCAVVAQTRQRLVDAATVIQRRWKGILEARQRQLESDVLAFQALARGWAIRRWVRRITAGRVGGKEKIRRVRGGW